MEKLQKTSDYSIFIEDKTNRSVTNTGLLVQSMETHGFIPAHPLHVVPTLGGKYRVKDGQHRLAAAKELGIPVYFVVCQDAKLSIPEINGAQRPWSLADYVNSWFKQGRKEYEELLDRRERSKLPLWICVCLLTGNGGSKYKGDMVRDGSFKVTSPELFDTVSGIIGACAGCGIKFAKNYRFVSAICYTLEAPGVSAKTLVERILSIPSMLQMQATTEDFVKNIEQVYNYRSRKPISIHIPAIARMRGKEVQAED